MAPDLIERTAHGGSETRSGSIPAGVSLRWGVRGSELRSTRGQQGRHPQKGTLSPIPNARNGRLEGVRLTQQYEGGGENEAISEIPAHSDSIVECKRKTALAARRVLEGQVPAGVANPEVLNRLPWAAAR